MIRTRSPELVTSIAAAFSRRSLARRDTYRTSPEAPYWLRVYRRAMACRFEVTLAGEDARWVPAARAALDVVDAIEARLTVFRDTSAVVHLNRTAAAAPVCVEADLCALVRLCQQLNGDTEHAFDVTSMPLSRCWGFLRRQGRVPTAVEIASALSCVGMHHVLTDDNRGTIAFDRVGVELNFGAIGKGWALDRMAATLQTLGVRHALLSAGHSSVRAVGGRGRGWHIDLKSPRVELPLARVWLRSGALGTSGAGEQFFEVDRKRYGHVIDPRTGWPAEGVLSVSVIAEDAARADALSTAFCVGGVALARRYCDRHPSILVIFTPDSPEPQAVVIGEYAGADVEVA